ncbi:MAG: amino acid ABC transporter permease [Spirochaetia bacterium]|jgi:polar amino acid transport system permease protein|nr:amino acid ABC transporter permease [Spirochaetia bacterium]
MIQKLKSTLAEKHHPSWYIGIVAFFLVIIISILMILSASKQIDYVWQWNRVPTRFFTHQVVKSDTKGEIKTITIEDNIAIIEVKSDYGIEIFKVEEQDLLLKRGDFVSPGTIIAESKKFKPGILLEGLGLTLLISLYSSICGIIIGLFGGLARVSKNPGPRWLSAIYVEIIRGSPLLVQILIWYFVIGTLVNDNLAKMGMNPISPVGWGIISLSIFAGAYVTEIVRGGIESVPKGQMEAARSSGMTYIQAMIYIILPQALKVAMPALTGQFISLIKDSSLLGIIALRELTKASREIVASTMMTFEFFLILAVLYLVLTFPLSMFVKYLEQRAKVK